MQMSRWIKFQLSETNNVQEITAIKKSLSLFDVLCSVNGNGSECNVSNWNLDTLLQQQKTKWNWINHNRIAVRQR